MSKKMNFKRVLLCALLLIASVIDVSAYSSTVIENVDEANDSISIPPTEIVVNSDSILIEDIMNAIVYVESRGKLTARNGSCCGPMQISPGMVKCCNDILKKQGSSKKFTLNDRFNLEKSKSMFRVFNGYYNPKFDVSKAIRSWNGGLGYNVRSTQKYYNKVIKRYNEIARK